MSKNLLIIAVVIFIAGIGLFLLSKSDNNNRGDNVVKLLQVEETKEDFLGEKGEKIELVNGQVEIAVNIFDDNQADFFNTELSNGKTIYFFVVKDKNGIYHVAANACQVCFDAKLGFRQEENNMVCETCGNKYPLEKIATEKGGCNPGPINPNLEVKDGKISIKELELKQVSNFF